VGINRWSGSPTNGLAVRHSQCGAVRAFGFPFQSKLLGRYEMTWYYHTRIDYEIAAYITYYIESNERSLTENRSANS
jgi:hypothetical protein